MNRRELAAVVAKDTCITKSLADKAVESVLAAIRRSAKRGVQLVGFGSFTVVKRRARDGRNPQTGAAFTVKACNVIKFRPGTEFKKLVN
ncbi:MAG TPA: HU family DNA-binding protein [Chitinivibrionales bacterium]|jgi:DNA-binding protein HU-beta|nr:HU family DNA-binding protein [Chitinivibrionales bacterium]